MKGIVSSKVFTIIMVLLVLSAAKLYGAEMKALKFKDQKIERDYILYVPDNIKPGAPFVYVLHGYGGNNKRLTQLGFNELADKNGFAVCYPLGSKDKKGKTAGM
jgi:Poly(3-hydroxybutyrate) depolymerase